MHDAEDSAEVAELERRYQSALLNAAVRKADGHLHDFEIAIGVSVAIIARSANELQRLATSDNEIYATHYELIEAGVRSHTSDKWSILRAIADEALFPGYRKDIRFAALALEELGLSNYGECSVVLRTDMIAHRASVFEENSTVFMKRHRILMSESDNLPRGYRTTWENRGKLCVAKLGEKIDASIQPDKYSEILLQPGATTADDDFVEVHIWGPMTARTIEQVTLTQRSKSAQRVIIKALKERFDKAKVSVRLKVK